MTEILDPRRAADAHARAPEAQRLYDEALALLAAGRLPTAVRRLEDALRLSPGDLLIAAHLRRLAHWT